MLGFEGFCFDWRVDGDYREHPILRGLVAFAKATASEEIAAP
jgi:hypothetical protein